MGFGFERATLATKVALIFVSLQFSSKIREEIAFAKRI